MPADFWTKIEGSQPFPIDIPRLIMLAEDVEKTAKAMMMKTCP